MAVLFLVFGANRAANHHRRAQPAPRVTMV